MAKKAAVRKFFVAEHSNRYTRDLTSQNFSEYINAIQNGSVKNDLVSLAQPTPPPISQKRYLFNKAHILSVNQLVPLNSIYQLRLNASYINDFQNQQSNTVTKFYLPDDTIRISEQNKYHITQNILQTDFSLIANTPNYYLKNNLKFQGTGSAERSRLITTNEINQQLKNPFYNVANDFKLLKTTSKYIKEYASYIGYVSLPQSLDVMPGIYPEIVNNSLPYDELIQHASLKTFYADNYLSLRKRKTKIAGQYKFGFNIQSQHLLTDLLIKNAGVKKSVADTFQNSLNWQRYRFYNENSWSYETSKWRISFTLPISYNTIYYKDSLLKVNQTKSGLFSNPNATVMLQLTPKWTVTASAGYNNGFGDISSINSGYILKTYRNLSNNNAPLSQIKSGNVSATVTFRNPLKIVFFNSGISFLKNKSNLIYSQRFNGNLETLTAFLENNYTNRTTVSGRYSKYLIDWKTSLGFNYSYSFGNQQQLQQNKLITFSNKNYAIGTTISAKISSKLTSDYTGSLMTYSSKSQLQSNSTTITSANQNFSLNYYPSQKIIFRATAEHYYLNNNIATSGNYLFADMSMHFTPKKSKIDYELICQNLFNTKAFTTAILLNNIETVSEFQLRPRQALFKMSFSF